MSEGRAVLTYCSAAVQGCRALCLIFSIRVLLALLEETQVRCPKGLRAGDLAQPVIWLVVVWGQGPCPLPCHLQHPGELDLPPYRQKHLESGPPHLDRAAQ